MNMTTPTMTQQQLKVHLVNKYRTIKFAISRKQLQDILHGENFIKMKSQKEWVMSKLYELNGKLKQFDYMLFTNGFGADRAYVILEHMGHKIIDTKPTKHVFPHGYVVTSNNIDFGMVGGDIVCQGNLSEFTIPEYFSK